MFRAWVKKHRRSLLVAAGLVGGGTALYYGVRYVGLDYQSRNERDAARAALLQKEAEDRAEAQYVHFNSSWMFYLSFVFNVSNHHDCACIRLITLKGRRVFRILSYFCDTFFIS